MSYWPDDQIICADTDELRSTPEGEEAWKEARKHGIGGSEAAAVCGVSDWASPYDVFLAKHDLTPTPFEGNEATHWGEVLEPVLAGEFASRFSDRFTVEHCPVMLRSREYPWMLSNPDKILWDADQIMGVLEIKTTSLRLEHEWTDSAPKSATVQAIHNAVVLGAKYAWVCCLVGGQKFVAEEVELDPFIVRTVIERERKFWHEHVLAEVAPPFHGRDADTMRDQWPTDTGEVVDLPDKARGLLRTYLDEREIEKQAKEAKGAAQAEIQYLLQDASMGLIEDTPAVTWRRAVDGSRRFNVTAKGKALV